jgi:hypothetical protein
MHADLIVRAPPHFNIVSCSSLIVSTKLLAETYTNPDKPQVIIHLFIDSKMIAKSIQA